MITQSPIAVVGMLSPIALPGSRGEVTIQRWRPAEVRFVALIIDSDADVAERLGATGAAVFSPDDRSVESLRLVMRYADGKHPGLPVALVGRPIGGAIPTVWIDHEDAVTDETLTFLGGQR